MAQLFKISLENNQGELLTMLLLLASKVTQIECSRVLYFLTGLVAHIDLSATLVSMHLFSHAYLPSYNSHYFSSGFYHGWLFLACVSFFGRGFQDCLILFVSICFLFMLVWRSRKRGAVLSFAPVYVLRRRHSLNPLSSPRLQNSTCLPQNLGVMAMSRIVLFAHDSFFGRGFQDCPIVFVSVCFPFLLVR